MTRCPPTAAELDPPSVTIPMQGLHTEFVNETTRHDENNPKLQLMWQEGCSDDRVYFVGGEHHDQTVADAEYYPGANHKVECWIPEDEWDKTWARVADGLKDGSVDNPNSFVSDPIQWIRYEVHDLVRDAMDWWLGVDDPFAFEDAQFDSWDLMHDIEGSTSFIAGMIAVFSLLFVAGRMVMQRNSEPARDTLRALITLVAVSAVGSAIVVQLIQASSWFTAYFVVKALPPPETDPIVADPDSTTDPLGPGITAANHYCLTLNESMKSIPEGLEYMDFFPFLLCATLIFVGCFIMFIYMVGRVFALTLLVGLLPLAAAGTATEFGKSWFDQNVRAILAFILIKPAGTVVFVSAIRLAEEPDGTRYYLIAAMLLCFGTVLLPAMVVLMFPFIAPAAGGGGAAKSMAIAPVALGAKAVKSGVTKLRK